MPKTNKKKQDKKEPILWAVIGMLVVACGLLATLLVRTQQSSTARVQPSGNVVTLGIFEYTIANGRAIKRHDASVVALRAFLENKASGERCENGKPAYENVIAVTSDETQALIRYGCGAADAPMHIIKSGGAWKSLSPTNHFDIFGIPECGYLTENKIDTEIAPVCADGIRQGPGLTYAVRH